MSEIIGRFASSPRRRALLSGLLNYRQLLNGLGYVSGLQFINGSFVEDVENREGRDPNDIDVFSFLERPIRYRTDATLWRNVGFPEWSNQIVNRSLNMTRFGLDTYAVAIDQISGLDFILATTYWSSLFAHKRMTHDWKGFLRVPIDFSDDVVARALL